MTNSNPRRGIGRWALTLAGLAIFAGILTALLWEGQAPTNRPIAQDAVKDESNSAHLTDAARAEVAAARMTGARLERAAAVTRYDIAIVELDAQPSQADATLKSSLSSENASILGRTGVRGSALGKVEVAFVAGLNAGKKGVVVEKGDFAFSGLQPGVGILQLTYNNKKHFREVYLTRGRPTRLDFNLDNGVWSDGWIFDSLTNLPVVRGTIEMDAARQFTDAVGKFSIVDATTGKLLLYSSAKGYEERRTVLVWNSHRRGQVEPVKIPMRRSTPIIVSFDGLSASADPPIAVVVPGGQGNSLVAFEKCCVVQCVKGMTDLAVHGIASDEEVRVYMLSNTGLAVPAFRTLTALDPAATIHRAVKFNFESRKPLRGQVLHAGVPVKGAMVTVEADSPAAATESFFGAHAFARFPFPVLPCAVKQVSTDDAGEFNLEVADIALPARVKIEKLGLVPVTEGVPSGSFNLGGIELAATPSEAASAETPTVVILEFADARPRSLTISYLPAGIVKPMTYELNLTGFRSEPIPVAPGPHRLQVGKGPGAEVLTIAAKGETIVKLDKLVIAGR